MYKYVEENDVNDADDDEEEDDMDEEEGGEGSNTIAEREKCRSSSILSRD